MSSRFPAGSLSVVLLLVVASSAPAVIFDSFSTGVPGSALNGRVSEVGNATWFAGQYLLTSPLGGVTPYTVYGQPDTRLAVVPFVPSDTEVTTIDADLLASPIAVTHDYWNAMAFARNVTRPDSGVWHNDVSMVSLLLRYNGGWTVYAKGVDVILATGMIPDFNGDVFHHGRLSWDPANNTVSAWVDGVSMLSEFDLDTIGFRPDITHVGMHTYGEYGQFDNFQVTPEPMSLLVLLVGAVARLHRRRA